MYSPSFSFFRVFNDLIILILTIIIRYFTFTMLLNLDIKVHNRILKNLVGVQADICHHLTI